METPLPQSIYSPILLQRTTFSYTKRPFSLASEQIDPCCSLVQQPLQTLPPPLPPFAWLKSCLYISVNLESYLSQHIFPDSPPLRIYTTPHTHTTQSWIKCPLYVLPLHPVYTCDLSLSHCIKVLSASPIQSIVNSGSSPFIHTYHFRTARQPLKQLDFTGLTL